MTKVLRIHSETPQLLAQLVLLIDTLCGIGLIDRIICEYVGLVLEVLKDSSRFKDLRIKDIADEPEGSVAVVYTSPFSQNAVRAAAISVRRFARLVQNPTYCAKCEIYGGDVLTFLAGIRFGDAVAVIRYWVQWISLLKGKLPPNTALQFHSTTDMRKAEDMRKALNFMCHDFSASTIRLELIETDELFLLIVSW